MNFKKVLIMICFLSSINCFANGGDLVGNGGNVVTCWNSPGDLKSIELLDFYESRTLRGIKADFGPADNDLDQAMSILLARFAEKNPTRALRYKEWYSSFFQEAILLPGIELIVIPDSNHIAIPAGCRVEQIVNQREPEFAEDKRYSINKDLWDRMDNNSKAGLILHELIYREAIKDGIKESTAVRYLNSLVAANRFKSLNPFQYLSLGMRLLFRDIDIFGASFDLCISSTDKVDNCSHDETKGRVSINFGSIYLENKVTNFIIKFQNIDMEVNTVKINGAGEITGFTPMKSVKLKTIGGDFLTDQSYVGVTDNGIIYLAGLAEDTKFELATGQIIVCAKDELVRFDKLSGRLIFCRLSANSKQILQGVDYNLTCSPFSYINFTSMGHYLDIMDNSQEICTGKVLVQGRWLTSNYVKFNFEDNLLSLQILKLSQTEILKMPNGQSFHFLSVELDKLGNIINGVLSQVESYKVKSTVLEIRDFVSFASDGNLLSAYINTPEFEWSFAGQKLKLGGVYKCTRFGKATKASDINFYRNGEIRSATLVQEAVVESANGKEKLSAGTVIHGLENGKIEYVDRMSSCK